MWNVPEKALAILDDILHRADVVRAECNPYVLYLAYPLSGLPEGPPSPWEKSFLALVEQLSLLGYMWAEIDPLLYRGEVERVDGRTFILAHPLQESDDCSILRIELPDVVTDAHERGAAVCRDKLPSWDQCRQFAEEITGVLRPFRFRVSAHLMLGARIDTTPPPKGSDTSGSHSAPKAAPVDSGIEATGRTQPGQHDLENVFTFKDEAIEIIFAGRAVTLRTRLGLKYLAILLGQPYAWISAIELSQVVHGPVGNLAVDSEVFAGDGLSVVGDSAPDEVVDASAVKNIKKRISECERLIRDAEGRNTRFKLKDTQKELADLKTYLRKATGLAGRPREFRRDDNRASDAVARSVKSAIAAFKPKHLKLHSHLKSSLHYGKSLCYTPDASIRWRIVPPSN